MPTEMTNGFDIGDDQKVIDILSKWTGGPISDALFTELARIIPQPCVETVILRQNSVIEVLLVPRPANDPVWPGMLHSPGQTLRAGDFFRDDHTPINGPFERVQKNEIKTSFNSPPEFVAIAQYMTKRGPEAVTIYLATIYSQANLPAGAGWYKVQQLETLENFISHQLTAINLAVAKFTTYAKNK